MHQAMSRKRTTILRRVSIRGVLPLWFIRLPFTYLSLTLSLSPFLFPYPIPCLLLVPLCEPGGILDFGPMCLIRFCRTLFFAADQNFQVKLAARKNIPS